jgi:anti-sigma regulatory factor (Ser/Thr protein kinase)
MNGGTGSVPAEVLTPRGTAAEHRSGAGTASQSWPVRSHLPFAALPSAVSCARLHVRAMCLEWGLHELAETAELLVSEIVTNAVRACERLRIRADLGFVPVVGLWLAFDGESLVLSVWDASDAMPVRQEAGPGDDGGRGLMIIDALSADWGCYREAGGKVVWALITAGPQP